MTRFVPDAAAAGGPGPADRCVLVCGRRVLAPVGGELTAVADLDGHDLGGIGWVSIGALDGVRVWAGGVPERVEALGAWRGWPAIAAEAGEPLAAITGRALQIVTWRQTHRYCGRCAAELADVPGEHARRCPSCALYVPMQLSPAVLVAVRRTAPVVDGRELAQARWFPLDALPAELPPPYSISRWLIDASALTVHPDPARSSSA